MKSLLTDRKSIIKGATRLKPNIRSGNFTWWPKSSDPGSCQMKDSKDDRRKARLPQRTGEVNKDHPDQVCRST